MLNIFSATVVFLRIFAAYLLVNTSLSASLLFSMGKSVMQPQSLNSYFATTGLGVLALLLIAIGVLIYAKRIAGYITRDLESESIELSDSNYQLIQAVGFSLLGMYLLIYAFPAIVKILASYAFPASNNKYDIFVTPTGYQTRVPLPEILEVLLQIGLGLWLLIGGKGIAFTLKNIWQKGRTM
jgi:hypothetical protein